MMENNEVQVLDEQYPDEQYEHQLPELIEVQIIDCFALGFLFGLGLFSAFVLFAITGVVLFMTIVKGVIP